MAGNGQHLDPMALTRALLLRASRSTWLAEQFRRRAFARRAVRRFLPGEGVASAVGAAAILATERIGSVLSALGERVGSRAEACLVRDHYLGTIDEMSRRGLPAHISVKLTHLGLDVDRALCLASVSALAERVATAGGILWIDMEESHYVDATLALYNDVRAKHARVGICLQAYLHRTPNDLDSVLTAGGSVRLVKGAYREPPATAFPRKRDTDAAFLTLGGRMLAAARPDRPQVFGTHDISLVERLRAQAGSLGVANDAWEVHMLYGIRTADQRRLAAGGVTMRVLVSYGTHWFPWYVRRLAERPANVWFVLRSVVS